MQVFGIGWRVGQKNQPDEQFEAGDIQIGPGPVKPLDFVIGDLPGRDDPARAIGGNDWNPWTFNKIQGHDIKYTNKTKLAWLGCGLAVKPVKVRKPVRYA